MKRFLCIFLVLLFILDCQISLFAMAEKPSTKIDIASKNLAKDFTLPNLSGKMTKLSDFKNTVILLNFFATWCPPCKAEMPSMQVLYEKLKGANFEMIAVAIDKSGKSAVEPFIKESKYTFKILLDSENSVSDIYRILSIPTTFIIDKKGYIVSKFIGSRDWSDSGTVSTLKKLIK
jgi:peroxiredoxin